MFYLLASKCVLPNWHFFFFLSFQFLLYSKLGAAHFIFRIRKLKLRDSRRLVSWGGLRPTCSQGPPSAVARETHDVSGAKQCCRRWAPSAADAQGVWEALIYSSVSSQPCSKRAAAPLLEELTVQQTAEGHPHQPCASTQSWRNPGNRQFSLSLVRGLSQEFFSWQEERV